MQVLKNLEVTDSNIKNLCDLLSEKSDTYVAETPSGGYVQITKGEVLLGVLEETDGGIEYLASYKYRGYEEKPKIRITRKISLIEGVLLLCRINSDVNETSEKLVEILASLEKEELDQFRNWVSRLDTEGLPSAEEAMEFFM